MTLEVLEKEFSVCRIASVNEVDFNSAPYFLSRTDDEISLVCESGKEPKDVLARESGWRGLRVKGSLDFSLVGVLAGITDSLARAGVALFAVSTYQTDYVFVKAGDFEKACAALEKSGRKIAEKKI